MGKILSVRDAYRAQKWAITGAWRAADQATERALPGDGIDHGLSRGNAAENH